MEFKQDINYLEILSKYVTDANLSNEIQCNIGFVENYLDKVEDTFSNDKEKQLAYKQLGVMAFSCVEALWKSIVLIVNNNCKKRACKQTCKYNQYSSVQKLSNAPPKKILDHLTNMRLLYVHPFEEIAIENLQNMRNHIHLMRTIVDKNKSIKFDKQFVEDMLRLYYVTINQAELNQWYYNENNPCLKELDGNDYDSTQKQQVHTRKEYYTDKAIMALIDIFYKKSLLESNALLLQRLNNRKDIDVERLCDDMGKWLYYECAHFRTDEGYENALTDFYQKIKPYLSEKNDLIERINKHRIKYQNLFRLNV